MEKDVKIFFHVHYLPYFAPVAFYLFLKVKLELKKRLVDPGHHQEELAGGRPHCRYRRTCRCYPGVDRVQQKNTPIADDHAKKITCVLHSMCTFFIEPPADNCVQKDMEKEEYGLLYAVICCAQPLPLTPLPPHLAHQFTCPGPGLSGLEEQGRAPLPPPTPTPLDSLRLQR